MLLIKLIYCQLTVLHTGYAGFFEYGSFTPRARTKTDEAVHSGTESRNRKYFTCKVSYGVAVTLGLDNTDIVQ